MARPRRKIVIDSPRGQITTLRTKNGSYTSKLTWNPSFSNNHSESLGKAQDFIDSECLRCMNPLTPRRTGALIKSGTLGTTIGSGYIEYLAPYARRQYYEHKSQAGRGRLWFERMKAGNKDTILKGAAQYAGSKSHN